jgi:uncharacterized protein YjgD (DUF1641 family)
MGAVTLIIAIVALIIAIVAYYRTGGLAALKKQVEALTNAGETMVSKASDSLRDRTADVLGKVEDAVRGEEQAKEEPKTSQKK